MTEKDINNITRKKASEKSGKKETNASCETCEFFIFDEFMGENVCGANLDEDEYYRMVSSSRCPFYKFYDEYKVAQKQ